MFTNRHRSAVAAARTGPTRSRMAGVACTVLFLAATAAACGSDDSGDSDAASTTATPTTAAPTTEAPTATTGAATTTGAGADVADFCQAVVAVEASTASEEPDPAVVTAAFDDLTAVAPADIAPAAQTAVDEAAAFLESGGEPTPAFEDAHAEVLDYVGANCGFGDLTATASEYAFGGLPATLEAGPAVVTLENIGAEFHMMLFARINDGVTNTLDELLAMPEDEVNTKVTDAGSAFAAPGGRGQTVIDLEPGRYAVVCFIPQGATPDNMAAIESGEMQGAPHAMLGMTAEIQVG